MRPQRSTSSACRYAWSNGEDEDLLQHLDHVIVGVIVVVQEDYLVERDQLVPFHDFRFGSRSRASPCAPGPSGIDQYPLFARRATTAWENGIGIPAA